LKPEFKFLKQSSKIWISFHNPILHPYTMSLTLAAHHTTKTN